LQPSIGGYHRSAKLEHQQAEEIDALEERSSQLRDQLRGMSNSAPRGSDRIWEGLRPPLPRHRPRKQGQTGEGYCAPAQKMIAIVFLAIPLRTKFPRKDMHLRAILIDPHRQKISELRIPRSPDKQRVINALPRLIGCATMKFA
jgi:hypothetical protein